jgi:hypothetical protein
MLEVAVGAVYGLGCDLVLSKGIEKPRSSSEVTAESLFVELSGALSASRTAFLAAAAMRAL